jgi:hypothetical protein
MLIEVVSIIELLELVSVIPFGVSHIALCIYGFHIYEFS